MYLNFNERKIALLIFNHLIKVITIKISPPLISWSFILKVFHR